MKPRTPTLADLCSAKVSYLSRGISWRKRGGATSRPASSAASRRPSRTTARTSRRAAGRQSTTRTGCRPREASARRGQAVGGVGELHHISLIL